MWREVGDGIVNIILSDNKYNGIVFNGIMLYYRYDDTGNVTSYEGWETIW